MLSRLREGRESGLSSRDMYSGIDVLSRCAYDRQISLVCSGEIDPYIQIHFKSSSEERHSHVLLWILLHIATPG